MEWTQLLATRLKSTMQSFDASVDQLVQLELFMCSNEMDRPKIFAVPRDSGGFMSDALVSVSKKVIATTETGKGKQEETVCFTRVRFQIRGPYDEEAVAMNEMARLILIYLRADEELQKQIESLFVDPEEIQSSVPPKFNESISSAPEIQKRKTEEISTREPQQKKRKTENGTSEVNPEKSKKYKTPKEEKKEKKKKKKKRKEKEKKLKNEKEVSESTGESKEKKRKKEEKKKKESKETEKEEISQEKTKGEGKEEKLDINES